MLKEKLLDPSQKIIIAIDGTAGSGKGTLAKLIAEKFGLLHCQTSLFYRSLALEVLDALNEDYYEQSQILHKPSSSGEISSLAIKLSALPLNIETSSKLYTPEVTEMASIISAIPEVRENLKQPQRDFLKIHPRIVMEGRDIGTVIAPRADLKLFITADLDIRAERRHKQMNRTSTLDQIKQDLAARDLRDSTRATAPLTKAEDAIEIDTSYNTPEEIIDTIFSE